MLDLKIGGVPYKLKQSIDDLTVGEYLQLIDLQNEREIDKVTTYNDGTSETKYKEDESEEFKKQKTIKILNFLSKIPKKYLQEYPDLIDICLQNLGSFVDDTPMWEHKQIGDRFWKIDKFNNWTFQQFVDIENYSKKFNNSFYSFVISLYEYKINGKYVSKRKYDRFLPTLQQDYKYWLQQPAKGIVGSYIQFRKYYNDFKSMFIYIFNNDDEGVSTVGENYKRYLNFAGWEDTIVSLANDDFTKVNQIRNSNCYEVLEFLNLRYGKSKAESYDYKNKKNNIDR